MEFAEIWWDYDLPSGCDWDKEIREKFENAAGYFVLGSEDYIKSEYIRTVEWPAIEKRVNSGKAELFWVTMDRPVGSYTAPIELSRFQTAAGRSAPLKDIEPGKKAEFLTDLAEEIATYLVSEIRPNPRGTPRPAGPVEIEALYLEALRNQCARLVNRDRYLPMQKLYVRLKADERTSEERKAGEELAKRHIKANLASKGGDNSSKTPASIIEEHLKKMTEVEQLPNEASAHFSATPASDALEDIFQKNRFLVVRGDPGSGKTVLCWKIAASMEAAWREGFESRSPKGARKITEFGLARLPILISIRDYAKACRMQNHPVPLEDFIGRHFAREDSELSVDPSSFNGFLMEQIASGRAIILLDGLDEVPAMDRYRIVESIQNFLGDHILKGMEESKDDPGNTGGNQLLITSRLAGYELAPITDNSFRHFIIRPFDEQAIEDHCRHWAEMVFRPRTPNFGSLGDALVAALLRESNPAIRDLARNPLLLQVLCELAAPRELPEGSSPADQLRHLPRSRAEIYRQAITTMSNRWKLAYESVAERNDHVRNLLEPGKMEELLSHVAYEMHSNEVLTRATATQLSEWLEIALTRVERTPTYTMAPEDVSRTITALMNLVRTHLGVISESAPGVFQFHHLTFQEYLAGRASCVDFNGWKCPEMLGTELAGKLLDQRWREPALLAFGHAGIASRSDPAAPPPSAIIDSIVKAWDGGSLDVTPEESALLAGSLVLELPDDLLPDSLDRAIRGLVTCYKTWGEAEVQQETLKPFVQGLTKLRRRMKALLDAKGNNPFDRVAARIIEEDCGLSPALARICVDRGWLTPPVLSAFSKARRHDRKEWNWPLHQGLRRAVLDRDDLEPKALAEFDKPDSSSGIQARNNHDRAIDAWREQKLAEAERVVRPRLELQPSIKALLAPSIPRLRERHPLLFRTIIALCGGFSDFQCARWVREYADISVFLQQNDGVRDVMINDAPELFLTRWGSEDTIYNMAVYLDIKQEGRTTLIQEYPEFSVESISHDPTASMVEILGAFINQTDFKDESLLALLRQLAEASTDPEVAAEAWVALLAAGQSSGVPTDPKVLDLAVWHCERITDSLRDPVLRFSTTNSSKDPSSDHEGIDSLWKVLDRWLPSLPDHQAAMILRMVMQAMAEVSGEPVRPTGMKQFGDSHPETALVLWAENWASALAGRSDDEVYNLAVALDTMKFGTEPIIVYRQLEAIVKAANFQFVDGSRDYLAESPGTSTEEEIVDLFLLILQFLCEVAGGFHPDFRAGLFNVVAGELLKKPGPHPIMLLLLADYLDAPSEDGFPIAREEFEAIRRALSSAPGGQHSGLSSDWKMADALSENRDSKHAETEEVIRLCLSDAPSSADGWKALGILLACQFVLRSVQSSDIHEDLWFSLKNNVQLKTAIDSTALGQALTQAGSKGLTLNSTTARFIEDLANIGSEEAACILRCILPLFGQVAPTEISRLRSWVEGDHKMQIGAGIAELLSVHAALLLAENIPVLEPEWIEPISELAHEGDDWAAARALLVLQGPFTYVNRGDRRRRLSVLGTKAIEKLVGHYFRKCLTAANQNILWLAFDDLHFDSADAPEVLQACRHPEMEQLSGLSYFFGFGSWTNETLSAFAEKLANNPECWNDSFLMGYGNQVFYQPSSEIPEALHLIMAERIQSRRITAHLLPEELSYGLVIGVCRRALREQDRDTAHTRAAEFLSSTCECLREGVPNGTMAKACSDLAESSMQRYGTLPEDCWPEVEAYIDDDRLFDLVVRWLVAELSSWCEWKSREVLPTTPKEIYSGRLRNALLCILTVMTERKRDEFALLTEDLKETGTDLPLLLAKAAVDHGKVLARMSAITLLSRLPNLDAEMVMRVFAAAVRDDAKVRDRALMLLPHFRNFTATNAFLDSALEIVKSRAPASVVLAYAQMLVGLLGANQVQDNLKRREIVNTLRQAAGHPQNIRILAHLAGEGSKDHPRELHKDGRLDQALLAVIAKRYSSYFENV